MADQPCSTQDILMARLAITQKISEATAEHLRLSQSICGMAVLEMGEVEETHEEMALQRAALDECEDRISELERDMSALDRQLENRTREDER